jgi:serine/threonine protein kinase
MEYVNGGTLFDYQNEVGILSMKQAVEFLKDIIDALMYLHGRSIAHRDIKPENIVINSAGIAKLCDFGWSAVVESSRSTFCGTLDYAPPEIIERKSYDCTVDLWCIGILTYELFVGKAPFESENRNEVMQRIVNVLFVFIQIDIQGIPMLN